MQLPKASDDAKALFAEVVPDDPRVVVKPMFGNLGAFVNGNMFAGLFGDRIGVRVLDDARRRASSRRPTAPARSGPRSARWAATSRRRPSGRASPSASPGWRGARRSRRSQALPPKAPKAPKAAKAPEAHDELSVAARGARRGSAVEGLQHGHRRVVAADAADGAAAHGARAAQQDPRMPRRDAPALGRASRAVASSSAHGHDSGPWKMLPPGMPQRLPRGRASSSSRCRGGPSASVAMHVLDGLGEHRVERVEHGGLQALAQLVVAVALDQPVAARAGRRR